MEYEKVIQSGTTYVSNRISSERIIHNNSLLPIISYTYDLNGNVTNISNNYFGNHQYTYNNLGYLMCDNNINFDYDTNGNIIENGQYIYEYDSSNPDRIISCHGVPITYSQDGLYIKDFGLTHYNFEGKRLTNITIDDGDSIDFTYNDKGLRTSKTINGNFTTNYFYSGDRLVCEINPTYRNDFLYDENGNLFGFIHNRTEKYFYIRDILQNILGIINSSGNIVVKYIYDAYGKLLSTTGTLASTIGIYNPFKYKGYYYDVETQLFYCNSRYYSPELCI